MPIRSTTEDRRSPEQAAADDLLREKVERTGGVWARMTVEQRAQALERLRKPVMPLASLLDELATDRDDR